MRIPLGRARSNPHRPYIVVVALKRDEDEAFFCGGGECGYPSTAPPARRGNEVGGAAQRDLGQALAVVPLVDERPAPASHRVSAGFVELTKWPPWRCRLRLLSTWLGLAAWFTWSGRMVDRTIVVTREGLTERWAGVEQSVRWDDVT
ncbi:hypothetical protein [Phycicoccus flavus]|uniref:hypothetical protein n=1 Tax=Phycicoccus flavus TaxID=2502783 RepID=UPI000FEBECFF|nr:hypothetical protein [Phycicoccus flavus]NHA67901.1 hypothetical protein [Phycicoccus flavus]